MTEDLLLLGAHHYNPRSYIKLIQRFGIDTAIAQNLVHNYGDRAPAVAELAAFTGQRWYDAVTANRFPGDIFP